MNKSSWAYWSVEGPQRTNVGARAWGWEGGEGGGRLTPAAVSPRHGPPGRPGVHSARRSRSRLQGQTPARDRAPRAQCLSFSALCRADRPGRQGARPASFPSRDSARSHVRVRKDLSSGVGSAPGTLLWPSCPEHANSSNQKPRAAFPKRPGATFAGANTRRGQAPQPAQRRALGLGPVRGGRPHHPQHGQHRPVLQLWWLPRAGRFFRLGA